MISPDSKEPSAGETPPVDDAATGIPGLRTWRAVYVCVGAIFVLWVVLLTVLTRWFS